MTKFHSPILLSSFYNHSFLPLYDFSCWRLRSRDKRYQAEMRWKRGSTRAEGKGNPLGLKYILDCSMQKKSFTIVPLVNYISLFLLFVVLLWRSSFTLLILWKTVLPNRQTTVTPLELDSQGKLEKILQALTV